MLRTSLIRATRGLHSSAADMAKVAVLGAAGGIGQPLSLLLKESPLVSELALYDVRGTPGVAVDLSHINTPAKVTVSDNLADVLTGCEVVIIPAGVPRKPGMTRDDLFNTNASIVHTLAKACCEYCPNASVGIISNPVNSTVPIFAEAAKKAGTFNPSRLFGVTTLDVVRANAFVAEKANVPVQSVDVPVVGGHSGITILPLLSQAQPKVSFDADTIAKLTDRIQNAGTEVVEAKAGAGSATLSMAFAGARFVFSLLRAAQGESGVTEYAYIRTDLVPGTEYFSVKLSLGKEGVQTAHALPEMSPFELEKLKGLMDELNGNIKKGVEFVEKNQ